MIGSNTRKTHKGFDPKATMGRQVMKYLYTQRPGAKKESEAEEIKTEADEQYKPIVWQHKPSLSDAPGHAQISDMHEPPLRVSNLISKQADGKAEAWKPPMSVSEFTRRYHNVMGSPIVESLALAAIPAAAVWGIHKYTHPDKSNGKYTEAVISHAAKLKQKDIDAAVPLKSDKEYMEDAVNERAAKRWKLAGGLGLTGALLLHSLNYNPNDLSQLYKYVPIPKQASMNKKANMFGGPAELSYDFLYNSIAQNPSLNLAAKQHAINVLNYNPSPYMSPVDIVNNAVLSGESAKAGFPVGRMAVSVAADAAAGYGLAHLLGAEAPGRWAALAGLGSLINTLSK